MHILSMRSENMSKNKQVYEANLAQVLKIDIYLHTFRPINSIYFVDLFAFLRKKATNFL